MVAAARALAAAVNIRPGKHPHRSRPVAVFFSRRLHMTWQTPTAVDFRFGFEITMYVAAR